MSKILDEVLAANQAHVGGFGNKGSLALPPARQFAILTCMVEDVQRIRRHPLVPKNIPIHGFYYDVKIGKLVEVADAMQAGRAL